MNCHYFFGWRRRGSITAHGAKKGDADLIPVHQFPPQPATGLAPAEMNPLA